MGLYQRSNQLIPDNVCIDFLVIYHQEEFQVYDVHLGNQDILGD